MNNLLFDLDGTLWRTNNAYLYGYHKIVKKYNISNPASDEEILKFLGRNFEEIYSNLFVGLISPEAALKDCVTYSLEYIANNLEESLVKNVASTIRKLSNTYKIAIVSNCPLEYAKTFLKLSGLDDLAIECYTIESLSKKEAIKLLSKDGHTIYVGDSYLDYDAIDDHYKCRFIYANYGYDEAHEYDYKIESFDELEKVIKEIEIKDEMLKGKEWRAFSSNDSNITLIRNPNGTDYFGFVNFYDNNDDQDALNKLKDEINRLKIEVTGPINGNTFYPYRFAIDNFDLKLYPDCNNTEETYKLFINNGFKIKQKYVSTLAGINHKIWNIAKKIKLGPDYTFKTVSGDEAYKYIDELYSVAVDAFTKGDYYEPISKEDFVNIYMKNIAMVSPDIILCYRKDELVAFNFCYEDLEKRFYVWKTIGIKKEYQKKLIVMPLGDYSYRVMEEKGYNKILYHFQNDRTKVLEAIYKGYIDKQKYYALLEYSYEK